MGILHQFTRRIVWRRLAEPSTWAGIVGLVAGLSGVTLSADDQAAYVSAGVALAGLLQIFIREASPGQVAKSTLNAAAGGDQTDADRVRAAVSIANAAEPPATDNPAPRGNAGVGPTGLRDSHGRVRNVPADDPRSS